MIYQGRPPNPELPVKRTLWVPESGSTSLRLHTQTSVFSVGVLTLYAQDTITCTNFRTPGNFSVRGR